MTNTTKQELTELIDNMKTEMLKNVKSWTQLPQFYQELLEDLNNAQIAVDKWNYDLCFDIIWDINLDMLEMVDDLDDIIWITMKNLYTFKKKLKSKWKDLPNEIYDLLIQIQKIIKT